MIRSYRNSVAHSKYFYKVDYDNCNKILNNLLKQLDRAIVDIETRTFSNNDIGESISVFAEAIGLAYQGIIGNLTPVIKKLSETMAKAVKINIPKIQFDMPKVDFKIAQQLSSLTASVLTPTVLDAEKLALYRMKLNQLNLNTSVDEQTNKKLSDTLESQMRKTDISEIKKQDDNKENKEDE